jgi:hypothetical protein
MSCHNDDHVYITSDNIIQESVYDLYKKRMIYIETLNAIRKGCDTHPNANEIKKIYREIQANERMSRMYPCNDQYPCNSPNCKGYDPEVYCIMSYDAMKRNEQYSICFSAMNEFYKSQIYELFL